MITWVSFLVQADVFSFCHWTSHGSQVVLFLRIQLSVGSNRAKPSRCFLAMPSCGICNHCLCFIHVLP